MSLTLMAAIWEDDSITNPTEKLLLLALADHANDDGVCWPSIDRLARRAQVSERQAQRLITKLIDDGRLRADRRGGRNRCTVYRLEITKGDAHVTLSRARGDIHNAKRVTSASQRVTSASQKGDTHVTPIPNESPIESGRWDAYQNGGGEGNRVDAQSLDDAAAPSGLPDEVIAAWDAERWPLTDVLRKGLGNMARTYGTQELLYAIEAMKQQPGIIEKPAGYLKRILQRRVSALVDAPPVVTGWLQGGTTAPAPSSMPTPTTTEETQVRAILAEKTRLDVAGWEIAVQQDRVTVRCDHAEWLERIPLKDLVEQVLRRNVELEFVPNRTEVNHACNGHAGLPIAVADGGRPAREGATPDHRRVET